MPLTPKFLRRWDSSDPERAPPPLPLNPNPSSPIKSTVNTSANIAAAHQAMAERAREASAPAPYTTNPLPERIERSPERSLVKGAAHRRLQSLQNNTVRDIRALLDTGRSADRSPERPSVVSVTTTPNTTNSFAKDYFGSPEKSMSREGTPTPTSRDHLKETPTRRQSTRPPPKAILGENTPPSATMLALQTMNVRDIPDTPLSNITNGSTRPHNFEAISTQILGLTSIATSLQQEMKHLSQRSKDNASDLNKLKEATNSRDEDIRKSLRELINQMPQLNSNPSPSFGLGAHRSTNSLNPTATPPPPSKSFTMPRITSPVSLYDERVGSPNPYSVEGAASVAMLEKIIREMVTKDGQERLLGTLNQLFEKANKESGLTAKKVADLVDFVKGGSSGALVCANGHTVGTRSASQGDIPASTTSVSLTLASRDLKPSDTPAAAGGESDFPSSGPSEFVNDDMVNLLKKIKDSVFHSGGLISEVKAQQRDLRGEVLHMGRNIAQKIDEARRPAGNSKAIEDGSGKQDVARIVAEGLADLKAYLDNALRDKRRQSSSSTISRATVDSREVYDVVKHALVERGLDRIPSSQVAAHALDRDAILDAVKEAYEAYKPEVEISQYGLERDEILQCLKEGLNDYKSNSADASAMSRAEIMETIHEAMQNFVPPRPINEAHEVRDEILATFRECLDEMKPSLAAQSPASRERDLDITREVVFDTVKSALAKYGPGAPQEIEISEEILYLALMKALETSKNPLGSFGDDIRGLISKVDDELRHLFQEYSAAHGRDTEQVLDHFKDGLEDLRRQIEQYVDRAQDVTGKDEIIEEVRGGIGYLRSELEKTVTAGPQGENAPIIAMMQEQFDQINRSIAGISATTSANHHQATLDAVRAGFDDMRSSNRSALGGDDATEAIKDELEVLQEILITRSGGHKDEILDTLSAGFSLLEAKLGSGSSPQLAEDMERLRSAISNQVARSGDSMDDSSVGEIRHAIDSLKVQLFGESYESSRSLLSSIQSEFDDLKASLESGSFSGSGSEHREMLESMGSTIAAMKQTPQAMSAEALQAIHMDLAKLSTQVRETAKADTEEILDAVRLGLDDLRSHLEKKMDNPERQMSAQGEILDTINEGIESLKTELVENIKQPADLTVSYEILETLKDGLRDLKTNFESLKSGRPRSDTRDKSLTTMGTEMVLVDETDNEAKNKAVQIKPEDALRRDDLQKMEVMMAELQVKVEAMDANINDIPQSTVGSSGPAIKADLDTIENLLKDMQASLDLMASHQAGPERVATKEDTDAIETLLRNTKAKIEEMDPASGQIGEKLDGLAEKLNTIIAEFGEEMKENTASKDNILTVEALVLDLRSAVDEIKKVQEEKVKDLNDATKTDIDALMLVALEVKEKLLEVQLHGSDKLPTKSDLEELKGLVHDFRDSHDKLKESYECDIGVTAKAFDDRKNEASEILITVRDLKEYVQDVKDEMSAKMTSNGLDLATLNENINGMEQTISQNFSIAPVVSELVDTVNREFERVSGSFADLKKEHDEKTTAMESKHDEVRDAILADLCAKIDERCDALLGKFEEGRMDAMNQAMEQERVLSSAKEMSGELRVSIDTLGTTVTGMESTFRDLSNQFASNSAATIAKLEDGFSQVMDSETRAAAKEDHTLTHQKLGQLSMALDGLQADVTEYHPKFMVTLDEILAVINQHYSDSQKAKEEQMERNRIADEHSRAITEEIKSSFSSLPALLPPPAPSTVDTLDKYDDAPVHEKLDKLVESLEASKDTKVQLDRLDQIHQQVMATASEVSQFVASQSRLITEGHESKEKEIEEVALLLQRRQAEKEHVENDIKSLQDEKLSLLAAVEQLRAERDTLTQQKSRLGSDVSALQTALEFRKEELHAMDTKADALERRVRDMLLDHTGSLLRNRQAASSTPNNAVSRQRMASNISHSTVGSLPGRKDAVSSGLSLALKTRSATGQQRRNAGPPVAGGKQMASRRILSLNQISHNTPTGAHGFRAANNTTLAPGAASGGLIKRSHSVRSAQGGRKSSWNTNVEKARAVSGAMSIDEDKENTPTPTTAIAQLGDIDDHDETDEECDANSQISHHDFQTDAEEEDDAESVGTITGTEITTSAAGYADSFVSDEEDAMSRRHSGGTYDGASSYFTGSEMSRRSSEVTDLESEDGAESAVSHTDDESSVVVSRHDEGVEESEAGAERDEEAQEEQEEEDEHTPVALEKTVVLYQGPTDSDSGLGSEVPTAGALSGSETDYFRRAAEDAASSVAGA
jgi:DNA repair exonuclease SbcCD ATPase subunit